MTKFKVTPDWVSTGMKATVHTNRPMLTMSLSNLVMRKASCLGPKQTLGTQQQHGDEDHKNTHLTKGLAQEQAAK